MKFEDEFDVVPPEGNVFVNHEINGRSGHLGHALVEYEEGKILAFYPNCSLDEKGHSAVGWSIKGQRIMEKHGHSPISFSRH